ICIQIFISEAEKHVRNLIVQGVVKDKGVVTSWML
nr:hypothetical protein [Tanacetum cinerariifolium]